MIVAERSQSPPTCSSSTLTGRSPRRQDVLGGERPEPPAEAHELLRGEVLVGEEDDQVIQEGRAQCRDELGRHVLGEVEAGDLRAERAGERADLGERAPVGG